MAVSQMSDLKANLMLTLSAVMLQFALMKVSDPTIAGAVAHYWVITVGALTTIILSAWSTVPKTPLIFRERPDDGSLHTPPNILHFSNFIELSLPAYKRHMRQVMRSPPHTHEAILEEIMTKYKGQYILTLNKELIHKHMKEIAKRDVAIDPKALHWSPKDWSKTAKW